jgi:general secretion pathway protein M
MTINRSIDQYFARCPALAAGLYLLLIAGFCLTTLLMLTDLQENTRTRDALMERLILIEKHSQSLPREQDTIENSWPNGSPFLQGQTVTLASAALLQQVATAITKADGSLASSEMESQEPNSKDGFLRASATFEIEQRALQKLLYDIEAGMPFLFIDRIVVNPPASGDGARMRVLIQVSGRWLGTQ